MPGPVRRRFTLADMMALVAVVAVVFPLSWWVSAEPFHESGIDYEFASTSHQPPNWVFWVWLREPSCVAVALTLALIPLRWLGPRPPASRLLRQPGAVACLAGALAMVVGLTVDLAEQWTQALVSPPTGAGRGFTHYWYWNSAVSAIPLTILGVWMALALGGRWSAEASWIDRLGRILGLFWIAWIPVGWFWAPLQVWLPFKE